MLWPRSLRHRPVCHTNLARCKEEQDSPNPGPLADLDQQAGCPAPGVLAGAESAGHTHT